MSKHVGGLDLLLRNLDQWQANWEKGIADAADEIAHLLESYAKNNHAWGNPYSEDYIPTGNTDNSTKGRVFAVTRDYALITLSAGMEYNVFLEQSRNGKWSWLWPAIEANRERIMEILARHLG